MKKFKTVYFHTYKVEYALTTVSTNKYCLPKYALHRPAVQCLLSGQLYEKNTHDFVRKFCSELHGSIVHAGTFFGDMLPNFSKYVNGKIYAFEPVLENYILASLCVNINSLSNVLLVNAALSDKYENKYVSTTTGNNLHAGGESKLSERGQICVSMCIDMLNINSVVLIHLDIEGHELPALEGAKNTITRCRPVIAIEDTNNSCEKFLLLLNYEKLGCIPGLKVWAPKENQVYINKCCLAMSSSNKKNAYEITYIK